MEDEAASPELAAEASVASPVTASEEEEEEEEESPSAAEGEPEDVEAAPAPGGEEKPGGGPDEEPPAAAEGAGGGGGGGGLAEEEPPLEGAAAGEEPSSAEEEAEEGGSDEGEAEAQRPAGAGALPPREPPPSVTFCEGEPREPPPLQVGVELGRRISLSLWELERERSSATSLEPGTPEGDEAGAAASPEQETEEERAARLAEEQRQRAELLEQYRLLGSERGRLRRYSARLQGKLAELLNKAKGKERARAEPEQLHISDKEQRYSRYLAMLQELRAQQAEEAAWFQRQIGALQQSCHQKLAKVHGEWKAYLAAKKEVAVYTMGRRLGGRQAAVKQVDHIQAREQSKEREMMEVRLENVKLKHKIQRLEASLKAQEELAEGLHLIDFEQLKIENQTYNEKIEERNEELQKLRRKITNTVQVLTQVKEKLQFVEAENQGQKAQLMAVEALVAQKRDFLTKTKQARDRLRMDNQKLHQRCGLLGNTLLLRDFESKVEVAATLNHRLEVLKRHHAGLSLACKGVKQKIRGVKSFLPE